MLKRNNKERVIEEINENRIENIFNIIPNLSDKVLDYNQINFDIFMTFYFNIYKIKQKRN